MNIIVAPRRALFFPCGLNIYRTRTAFGPNGETELPFRGHKFAQLSYLLSVHRGVAPTPPARTNGLQPSSDQRRMDTVEFYSAIPS